MTITSLPAGYSERVTDFISSDCKLLIGGEWSESSDGSTFPTINPATEDVLADVAQGSAADVDRAVAAARAAYEDGPWSRTTPRDRGKLLWKVADLIEESLDDLAQLESLDNGKLVSAARGDIQVAAELFRYFAGWATKIEGTTIPMSSTDRVYHAYTRREPLGVVAGIVPWNFPFLMAAFKIVPSLTAGNTVVLKPAEQTPLSALWLGQLLLDAGLPPGVVNVVPGFGETGAALVAHAGVDKVAFTGSTETGKAIARSAASNLQTVSLELGGKAPNVIFADADLDAAVAGAVLGGFFNEGQCCVNAARLYIERPVFDEVVAGIAAAAGKVRLGSGFDTDADMGPLVSQEQHDKVLRYVRQGIEAGAIAAAGSSDRARDRGYFVTPTVLTGVSEDMAVQREEIFGPVVTAVPFDGLDEAVGLANNSRYGLAAGVWTRDIGKGHRVAGRLRAGTVWINTWHADDVTLPRGGFKESGWGRELGAFGLDDYTQLKTVIADIT